MTLSTSIVSELEADRCHALLNADVAWMQSYFAEDIVWAHASGAVDSKSSFIEQFERGTARCYRIDRHDVAARLFGPTAIVTGLVEMDAMYAAIRKTKRSRYQGVWVETADGPRLAAWQSARLTAAEQE